MSKIPHKWNRCEALVQHGLANSFPRPPFPVAVTIASNRAFGPNYYSQCGSRLDMVRVVRMEAKRPALEGIVSKPEPAPHAQKTTVEQKSADADGPTIQ